MKKSILLVAMILMSIGYSFSQTTMQEYTFADEDYGDSPHHTLLERRVLNDFKTEKGTIYIMEYLRKNNTLSCYSIQYKSNDDKLYYHLGIPSHNSSDAVLLKYKNKINKIPNNIKGLFLYWIVFYLGFES